MFEVALRTHVLGEEAAPACRPAPSNRVPAEDRRGPRHALPLASCLSCMAS